MADTLDDEVRDVLKELVTETRALSARIVGEDAGTSRTGIPARTIALGGGEFLRVELPSRTERSEGHEIDVEAAFDKVTRQLRAIRRRYEAARLPEIAFSLAVQPAGDRVVVTIEKYLQALATVDRATNAFVTKGTTLVAAARAPDDVEATRWPFLARRVLATHAAHSSHGEIVDPDAYAMSFWYDATLVVLLAEPYGVDFVRHRCRHVARELCNLLPLLEPDPDAPAAIGPRPRRPTQQ